MSFFSRGAVVKNQIVGDGLIHRFDVDADFNTRGYCNRREAKVCAMVKLIDDGMPGRTVCPRASFEMSIPAALFGDQRPLRGRGEVAGGPQRRLERSLRREPSEGLAITRRKKISMQDSGAKNRGCGGDPDRHGRFGRKLINVRWWRDCFAPTFNDPQAGRTPTIGASRRFATALAAGRFEARNNTLYVPQVSSPSA